MGFVYDETNQPTIVTGTAPDGTLTNGNYVYDGNLKRVKSVIDGKTIYNVYDASGSLVHVKETSPNKVTEYVAGPNGPLARLVNGQLTYMHPDHLGSPREMSNASGARTGYAHYSPFGMEINTVLPQDQGGFTGHIKDSKTGLNYMQARYYDPVIGRFLSVDPVTFMDTNNPVHFNRYAYANNDPINMLDPDGRMAKGGKKRPLSPGALAKAQADAEKYKGDRSAAGKAKYNKAIKQLEFQEKLDGKRNTRKRKTEFKKTRSLGKLKGGVIGLGLLLMTDETDALIAETEEALSEPQELTQTITGCTGDCDMAGEMGITITDPENNKPHPKPESNPEPEPEPEPKPREEEVNI